MSRRWLAAALLIAAGCGGGVLTPAQAPKPAPQPRDMPPIPRSFAVEQSARRRADGLKIRVYNTGSVVTRGAAVSSMKSWRSKVTLDVPVFLIKHPRHGYVLFDTGLHPDISKDPRKRMGRLNHFFVPFVAKPGQDAVSQLAADGVAADQVRWVVISHLHLDHAGLIDAFPKATVFVDQREWMAQKLAQVKKKDEHQIDPTELEGKISFELVDLSSAAAFGAFDHARDLFSDGSLWLVDLAGHTPGSMGLWANLEEGPVLLAGDASWILDNHQDLALPIKRNIFDLQQYWRRLYEMRAMQQAAPRLVIFPGHDLSPMRLQPRTDVVASPFPR